MFQNSDSRLLYERKSSRIFNQSANQDTHINQNMNYRGSKRQRENEPANTPLSGATSIEPSLGRMNVSTPPETGFQPMPPKNQNWHVPKKVPRIIDLVNPIFSRQQAPDKSNSLPFLEVTLHQVHPRRDNSGAFSFALLDTGSTQNIIN